MQLKEHKVRFLSSQNSTEQQSLNSHYLPHPTQIWTLYTATKSICLSKPLKIFLYLELPSAEVANAGGFLNMHYSISRTMPAYLDITTNRGEIPDKSNFIWTLSNPSLQTSLKKKRLASLIIHLLTNFKKASRTHNGSKFFINECVGVCESIALFMRVNSDDSLKLNL